MLGDEMSFPISTSFCLTNGKSWEKVFREHKQRVCGPVRNLLKSIQRKLCIAASARYTYAVLSKGVVVNSAPSIGWSETVDSGCICRLSPFCGVDKICFR